MLSQLTIFNFIEMSSSSVSSYPSIVIGRSPGKCLSLRRRKSNSEVTPQKQFKKDTCSDVQTDVNDDSEKITSRDICITTPATNKSGEDTSGGIQTGKGDTCPPRLSAFVLGTNSEVIEEKDIFNDSSQFEMPSIAITEQPDSELSPFDMTLSSELIGYYI